jgi:hypothetical protein
MRTLIILLFTLNTAYAQQGFLLNNDLLGVNINTLKTKYTAPYNRFGMNLSFINISKNESISGIGLGYVYKGARYKKDSLYENGYLNVTDYYFNESHFLTLNFLKLYPVFKFKQAQFYFNLKGSTSYRFKNNYTSSTKDYIDLNNKYYNTILSKQIESPNVIGLFTASGMSIRLPITQKLYFLTAADIVVSGDYNWGNETFHTKFTFTDGSNTEKAQHNYSKQAKLYVGRSVNISLVYFFK